MLVRNWKIELCQHLKNPATATTRIQVILDASYRKSKGFNMPSLCKLKIDFGPIPFKFSNFPNSGNKK